MSTAVWRAVRSDNLFHWLLSCFSHYHPLSLHLSSPPFSPFVISGPLPPSVCPSDSASWKNSHILHNNISHVLSFSVSFMHAPIYYLALFLSPLAYAHTHTHTHTHKLLLTPSCSSVGNNAQEWVCGVWREVKLLFRDVRDILLHIHTHTHIHRHTHKEDVGWTMDRSQEC